ncbi:lipid-A-disaccharide synthase [Halovulum dunhuangense]|uniref:Lipid-A-disaccharide synthase n=1 Tax=Halovulum dunhuangense TaxID=1505036 RepID=A0A849L3B4_9RHOB|nr:lipid-A-disaccharide synthase [Halovulum dunhuangense]NNU80704.1 lipid-A-disaccharide synthase [Halovulum dunhuangense]
MSTAAPRIFIIAGEASGDRLGAALMAGLRDLTGGTVRFEGIGGPLMAGEGLDSLFPMDRLSVMGLTEVLPRLPELMRLIRQTGDAVADAAPDALVTIDSPDFCLRVARRARRRLPRLRTIHYVAPSVWAWRPGRAAKMAKVIDHVLALLPFEPPYMTAAGMTCDFVGHPVAETPVADAAQCAAFRQGAGIAPDAALLCLLPGSRAGEVARHGALFREVLDRLAARRPSLRVVIPAVGPRVPELRALFEGAPGRPVILDPSILPGALAEARKRAAFAASTAALAVSGTVSLEVAAAGTPMVVTYRASAVSAFLAKRLVKVRHASLVNILEDAAVIPEFIFDAATPEALTEATAHLLDDPAARTRQTTRFAAAMTALGRGQESPGLRAARSVLTAIG